MAAGNGRGSAGPLSDTVSNGRPGADSAEFNGFTIKPEILSVLRRINPDISSLLATASPEVLASLSKIDPKAAKDVGNNGF